MALNFTFISRIKIGYLHKFTLLYRGIDGNNWYDPNKRYNRKSLFNDFNGLALCKLYFFNLNSFY